MKTDDVASLATRAAKDHSLIPTADRPVAGRGGRGRLDELERAVCFGEPDLRPPTWEEVVAALVDEEEGLCHRSARFTEADVVEHLCAVSGGRLTARPGPNGPSGSETHGVS